jgi:hemerythrin-like domain-containing protein
MSDPSLREYFTADHRDCDAQWAAVETSVDAGNAQDIEASWSRFDTGMRRHLDMEEQVLFPAFEQRTGMVDAGPTFVMRGEHTQMRGVLEQMAGALAGGDHRELLDLGDTLLMLIQQHNSKEERMLYPLAEEALASEWPELRARLPDRVESS